MPSAHEMPAGVRRSVSFYIERSEMFHNSRGESFHRERKRTIILRTVRVQIKNGQDHLIMALTQEIHRESDGFLVLVHPAWQ